MKKFKMIFKTRTLIILLLALGLTSVNAQTAKTGTQKKQTTVKSNQTKSKTAPASPKTSKPVPVPEAKKKIINPDAVAIGSQFWSKANLSVSTFRNGDTIPEVKTAKEWVAAGEAGKPAWSYYNNDPVIGKKYGKLYNWFAVNDPRGLAPEGWTLPTDEDWAKLTFALGGQNAAGVKIKSTTGWNEGENGTNESGFNAFPAGYRIENGAFVNIGTTGIWWSSTETKTISAFDRFVVLGGTLRGSSSPKQRGESVRCLLKTNK
jgi:uncharacterized protein (TIGR02145 family)